MPRLTGAFAREVEEMVMTKARMGEKCKWKHVVEGATTWIRQGRRTVAASFWGNKPTPIANKKVHFMAEVEADTAFTTTERVRSESRGRVDWTEKRCAYCEPLGLPAAHPTESCFVNPDSPAFRVRTHI